MIRGRQNSATRTYGQTPEGHLLGEAHLLKQTKSTTSRQNASGVRSFRPPDLQIKANFWLKLWEERSKARERFSAVVHPSHYTCKTDSATTARARFAPSA